MANGNEINPINPNGVNLNQGQDQGVPPPIQNANDVENGVNRAAHDVLANPVQQPQGNLNDVNAMQVQNNNVNQVVQQNIFQNENIIDFNALQAEVDALNDPNKSTQEVLREVKAKLEEKGLDNTQLSSSLKKENGSYVVEHYVSPDANGGPGKVCYKINAIYSFKDGDNIIKIERPIYTTVPVSGGKIKANDGSTRDINVKAVGILASKYKDLMVSQVNEDNRIQGYVTDEQKAAGSKQRAFVMKLIPEGKSIKIEQIKPYGTPVLKKVDITLDPKPSAGKYVKSLLGPSEDAKIKGARVDQGHDLKENDLEYSTKEEAFLKASFNIKKMVPDDTSFVDNLLETREMPEFLKNMKENIQKKQDEIKSVKNQLQDSSWFGLKKKESGALTNFINDRKEPSSSRIQKIETAISGINIKAVDNQDHLAIIENYKQNPNDEEKISSLKTVFKNYIPEDRGLDLNDIEITDDKIDGVNRFLTERSTKLEGKLNNLENEKETIKQQDEIIKSNLDRLQRLNQELEFMNNQLHSIYKTAGEGLKNPNIDDNKKESYKDLISSMNRSHRSGIKKANAAIEDNKEIIKNYKNRLDIPMDPLELEDDEFRVGDFI
ncbi:MAG: hypothetical protein Q8K60_03010 [Parachlamydiaceae bacterium]|nr:hypothetical protein [Parachlamydiaceae bacterium]